jgi:Fe-S-cluster containining protein
VKKRKAQGKPARVRRDAGGRVHLALARDPETGRELLALTSPVFEEAWQNELAVGAANTARDALGDAPSVAGVAGLAEGAMAATSRLIESLLARAPAGAIACKAGCDHCCHQSVGLTPPEALAIRDHLRATRSPEALAALAARIAELRGRTRGLTTDERYSPQFPCPFLEAGQCSIYEARPLACRGMNALDAGDCARRLRDPAARAEFLARGAGGRSFMEPIRAFHAVSAGLQIALAELYRLDMRPLDLVGAMDLLLNGPGETDARWLDGQGGFEPAVGAGGALEPR